MIALMLLGLSSLLVAEVSPPVQWVTGNGGLNVAIDDAGQLTQFHWPAVGRGQHLDLNTEAHRSAGWYLAGPEGLYSLTGDHWDIETQYDGPDSLLLVTRFQERLGGRSVEQRLCVASERDLLLVQIRLVGFAPETRLFWLASFAPFDGLLPGFHARVPELRCMNAFGSEYNAAPGAIVQFRPSHAGQEEWKQIRAWAADPTPSAVIEFDRGVYIGTISPNAIAHGALLADPSQWSDWNGIDPVPGATRLTGRAIGVLELVPTAREGELEASVIIGAESTRQALDSLLGAARQRGSEAILETTRSLGASWLAAGARSAGTPAARPLLNLLLCVDHERGAVRRAPADMPALAYSNVFESAWASAALDVRGYPDRAAQALKIHLEHVRPGLSASGPAGSLSATSYDRGVVATIQTNADPESAAWLLAAYWRHARELAENDAATSLASVWPVLESCAEYLAHEPEVGAGLSGAVPTVSVPLATLRAHYLGLESGRRLAELLGAPVPGAWVDRLGELYSRIRFRRLNQELGEVPAAPWIDWWIYTLLKQQPDPDASWEVLQTEGVGVLSEEAIAVAVPGPGLGPQAPLALRDALRCLLPG